LSPVAWTARASDLVWKSWDEELYVVYDAASGDTHVLDRMAGESVRQLQAAVMTSDQLAFRVGQALGVEVKSLSRPIADLIARLDRLGLIDPAT
jgi:PqqD family protein of HPr-rel-A system